MPKREVDWDDVHRRNYETQAFSGGSWFSKAKQLLESAKLLEPEVVRLWESYRASVKNRTGRLLPDYYQGTYYMLLAYAVENLFKGTIIGKHSWEFKEYFRATLKFPMELQNHNLVKLAKKAELEFNIEEEDLLRRLTRSAMWYGRYPVPLHYGAGSGVEKFTDGKEYSVSWFGGDDIERLNHFIDEIKTRLGIRHI